MKILYVLSGTPASGGATKSFLLMADAVAAAGHEVAVVVPDEEGVTPELRRRGWTVVSVPYTFCALPTLSLKPRDLLMFFPRMAKSVVLNLRARRKVNRFAREWGADIVHDNTSVTDLGHYAAKAAGCSHVIHVREYGWKDFRLVLPGLSKRMKWPDAWGVSITEDIASLRGPLMNPGRMRVVYNGIVDSDGISYNSKKSPCFLYGGRIEEAKGTGDLIDAYIEYCSRLRDADPEAEPLRLRLAGGAPYPDYLEALKARVEAAGLTQEVDWLGEIRNLPEEAARAAATVIPSRFEGFGRVMPEVMAAGSLCIARNTGGSAEQMSNGRRLTGQDIALPFMTVGELTDRLMEVDRAFRGGKAFLPGGEMAEMIARGQSTVGRLYSRRAYGESIVKLYSEIEAASRR